jgi:hypothetical protein
MAPERRTHLSRGPKPIVCNEDEKAREIGARAAEHCVADGCSWGLMALTVNQRYPFACQGPDDDPIVYRKLKELTTPAKGS